MPGHEKDAIIPINYLFFNMVFNVHLKYVKE